MLLLVACVRAPPEVRLSAVAPNEVAVEIATRRPERLSCPVVRAWEQSGFFHCSDNTVGGWASNDHVVEVTVHCPEASRGTATWTFSVAAPRQMCSDLGCTRVRYLFHLAGTLGRAPWEAMYQQELWVGCPEGHGGPAEALPLASRPPPGAGYQIYH